MPSILVVLGMPVIDQMLFEELLLSLDRKTCMRLKFLSQANENYDEESSSNQHEGKEGGQS